jgi:hypothetical protein
MRRGTFQVWVLIRTHLRGGGHSAIPEKVIMARAVMVDEMCERCDAWRALAEGLASQGIEEKRDRKARVALVGLLVK